MNSIAELSHEGPYYLALTRLVEYCMSSWFNMKVYDRFHWDYSRPHGFPVKRIWRLCSTWNLSSQSNKKAS